MFILMYIVFKSDLKIVLSLGIREVGGGRPLVLEFTLSSLFARCVLRASP